MICDRGLWNLVFAQDGGYLVEAWIDGAYGDWAAVPYQVRHGAATELAIVDQNTTEGWITIGIFDFAAGGDQWVRIDDAVDDANEAGKRIVFDALRLTPELQPEPEPEPEPEPGDDGGDPDDADPTDPDDSESTDFDDSDAADADVPENDPIVTDSGNEIREAKQGCACNGGGDSWPAVLLLLMLRCRRQHSRPRHQNKRPAFSSSTKYSACTSAIRAGTRWISSMITHELGRR